MGVSTSVAQMAKKLDTAGVELAKATGPMVQKAAALLQRGSEITLNAAAPGGHLRNVKNSRLYVRVTTTGTGVESKATVRAMSGAYAILDNPTRIHWIGIGRSTKRLKKGMIGPARPGRKEGAVLKIGNNYVTGPILHPGTSGKRTFLIGAEAATPAALEVLRQGPQLVIEGVFK